VELPDDAQFKPTGESPLKHHQEFLQTTCPQCGGSAERETDTMDTFICSSWYYYGYLAPYWQRGETLSKTSLPWDMETMQAWGPVDQYTGGIEHATMHLLYFRFYTKVLADMGLLDFREPATRLFNQGMILGEDHEKMSKSRGNVVNPDGLVQRYGSDTVRVYLMFLGPWDAGVPWNPHGIEGASRFLRSVWTLALQENPEPSGVADAEQKVCRTLHQTIKKVTDDLQHFRFNTAIAALMSFRNQLRSDGEQIGSELREQALRTLLLLLAPLAPHLTEELWQRCHPDSGSVHTQPWPEHDEALAADALVTLVVQVNGKLRDRLEVPTGMENEQVERMALESKKIQPHLAGRRIRKVVVVPNRLVNIVV
jgi:leucyl-tRNA synthetase